MAANWSVLVFGDSWADYMHPCWPQVLGERRLGARVFNFANAGSLVSDLAGQAQRALLSPQVPKAPGGLLKRETLVVIHTCGNDFIQKMVEGIFGGGTPELFRANPGVREAQALKSFLEMLYRGGARHFLVSGVPAFPEMPIWRMIWPVVSSLVAQGRLTELGVGPGDDPRLALDVQISALHDRWEALCTDFTREHEGCRCVFFDEVSALEKLRGSLGAATFDQRIWDFTMFHPSAFGHEQIAGEAHRTVAQQLPELAALAPHPEAASAAPAARAAPTPQASPAVQWECGVCTLVNGPARSVCEACDTPRPAAAAPAAPAQAAPQRVTVKVRNVKGDVTFTATSDASGTLDELKAAVLEAAPDGFVAENAGLVLAFNGKFLMQGGARLSELGLKDGAQVIAVARAPANSPKAESEPKADETSAPPKVFVPPPRS